MAVAEAEAHLAKRLLVQPPPGAEQTVPEDEQLAIIAVRFGLRRAVVDMMERGGGEQPAEAALDRAGQAEIGVGPQREDGGGQLIGGQRREKPKAMANPASAAAT